MDKKKFITTIAIIGVIAIGLIALILGVFSRGESLSTPAAVNKSISIEDQENIRNQSMNFLYAAGSFGMDPEQMNPNDYNFIMVDIYRNPSTSVYINSRSGIYKDLDAKYIVDGSRLGNLTPGIVNAQKYDSVEAPTFSADQVEVNVPTAGSQFGSLRGEQAMLVEVPFNFNSLVTRYSPIVDDDSSKIEEESHRDHSKDLHLYKYEDILEVTGQLTFVQDGDEWKIFNVEVFNSPFALVTWDASPSSDWRFPELSLADPVEELGIIPIIE